ncbi:PHD finger protein 20 isoform X3 [Pseudonaja textilis]|nr:PHD finger protein 20 isoform X3 [Pseudonaja textilis]
MKKHPPNRRGINFEVGAQLEARDRLKNWYPAHIEEIDYEEGKVLIHFKRWNHRYDEWFCWDSPYLRPLEKIQLRKEGLHGEEGSSEFHINDQVLACWSDCRFYPAKVTSVNKDGTYTVKFYDGVIQTVKNIHVKAFSKDQSIVNNSKPKERCNEIPSSPERWEKFKEQRKASENKKDKDEKPLKIERRPKTDKEGKLIGSSEKNKVSEKALSKDGKEDKENISENDREFSIDTQIEKKPENDNVKAPSENIKETKRRRGRPPVVPPAEQGSQTLQPITLELRRRKIPKGGEVPSKRPRLQKNMSQEKLKSAPDSEKDSIKRQSRHSTTSSHDTLDKSITTPLLDEIGPFEETTPKQISEDLLEACAKSDQRITEESAAPSELSQASVNDSRLKEENKAESSSTPHLQETSVTSVTVSSSSKRIGGFTASKAAIEHEPKFRCKFLDCSKCFRKAKLLHYHMKYFHGIEKSPEPQQNPATRNIQTRGSLASEKASQEGCNRRRTTSGCLSAKEKDKNKERKPRNFGRSKSKKKKKRKKKIKTEHSGSEENVDFSQDLSPPRSAITTRYNSTNRSCMHLSTQIHSSDSGHHKQKLKINEDDTLSESSTESLFWSDDDCSRDIDVTTNPDEDVEDDDNDFEIVRCICEVEEENDFMIQCEECLCWQHGVCMGLLEENVPEKYTCYVCQDPPGTKISKVAQSSNSKRSSLKYWYEKEWLCNGHMHGLAFLGENYSHQNAKKIVATHQLLGDVQKVIEVLHGLQLKMSILQSKEHPDLKLWCQPWKNVRIEEKSHTARLVHIEENSCKEETTSYRTFNGTVEKPPTNTFVEESYITSEHCYQKPRAYYPAIEQRLVVETRNSDIDDDVNRIRENGDDAVVERLGWELDREICKVENESKHNYSKVREKITSEEDAEVKLLEKDKDGIMNSQLQWQLNLLTHIESLQDEVTHRMDSIEKELDVLESWLDYTGELEPPEPLARLPQLKHCIKQLLTDLGKVQQIALCCST